jgi:hypothetical protein
MVVVVAFTKPSVVAPAQAPSGTKLPGQISGLQAQPNSVHRRHRSGRRAKCIKLNAMIQFYSRGEETIELQVLHFGRLHFNTIKLKIECNEEIYILM